MAIVKEITWCTTGHRAEPDYNKRLHRRQCAKQMVNLVKDKRALLLIGGARGWDWDVMQEAYDQGIRYKLYLPFMERLDAIPNNFAEKAVEVWYPFSEFNIRGYQIRNEKMVDDSTVVHSYWNGSKCWEEKGKKKCSGTWNCINYAIQEEIKVVNWYNLKIKTGFEHF